MERPCYNNPFTYDPNRYHGEVNLLPSETVPSQALSVEELFYRFARGLPTSDINVHQNYGDDIEQSDDNFEVHPLNQFGLDILDTLPPEKLNTEINTPENIVTKESSNATTTNSNDDDAKDVE